MAEEDRDKAVKDGDELVPGYIVDRPLRVMSRKSK